MNTVNFHGNAKVSEGFESLLSHHPQEFAHCKNPSEKGESQNAKSIVGKHISCLSERNLIHRYTIDPRFPRADARSS